MIDIARPASSARELARRNTILGRELTIPPEVANAVRGLSASGNHTAGHVRARPFHV